MIWVLLFILIVLIGGPWLLALVLGLIGIVFVSYQALVAASVIVFACTLLLFFLAKIGWIFATRPKQAMNFPLDAEFKQTASMAEEGIYQSKSCYLLEHNGRSYVFQTLKEARRERKRLMSVEKPKHSPPPIEESLKRARELLEAHRNSGAKQ